MIKSDIAVIEQYDKDRCEWFAIAFIGSDREGGEIYAESKIYDEEGQVRIRIRYKNDKNKT